MWNIIRKIRKPNGSTSAAISLQALEDYFITKFDSPAVVTDYMKDATVKVNEQYELCANRIYLNTSVSEDQVKMYINRLKPGTSPGMDKISPEHLKFGLKTKLPKYLSLLLTVCIQYGVLPESFSEGLLIPVLKKTNIDPTIPKHYRPITVSITISKLLEYHILDKCVSHEFSSSQFGFVANRGSNMATALAHDICAYSKAAGSTLFVCSLDAEGAFDNLPTCVMMQKAISVLPDEYWRILYVWYSQMSAVIKWNNITGNKISVKHGTRQGGLTSPFIFNLFYQNLIDKLNSRNCGITIGGNNYNVICYADDILLCSTTSSGLQTLINIANGYIQNCGLKFNPQKTECMLSGSNPFNNVPKWTIENVSLTVVPSIKYLGTILCGVNGDVHTTERKRAAQKAFFSLQGAGLKYGGVNPKTGTNIYSSAVASVMKNVSNKD